jgi:hypothetical protein
LPERVVRARSRKQWPYSVPRRAFAHLAAVRIGRRNAGRRASSPTDSTPIGPAHVRLAPRLNKRSDQFLLDKAENVVGPINDFLDEN